MPNKLLLVDVTANNELADDLEKILVSCGLSNGDCVMTLLSMAAVQVASVDSIPSPDWPDIFSDLVQKYRELRTGGTALTMRNLDKKDLQ